MQCRKLRKSKQWGVDCFEGFACQNLIQVLAVWWHQAQEKWDLLGCCHLTPFDSYTHLHTVCHIRWFGRNSRDFATSKWATLRSRQTINDSWPGRTLELISFCQWLRTAFRDPWSSQDEAQSWGKPIGKRTGRRHSTIHHVRESWVSDLRLPFEVLSLWDARVEAGSQRQASLWGGSCVILWMLLHRSPVQIMKQECGSFSSWNLGCVEILQILLPKWSLWCFLF